MATRTHLTQYMQIDEQMRRKWTGLLDTLAELMEIPAALLLRVDTDGIVVFEKSGNAENVYDKGDRSSLNTGLYCETVLAERARLIVPNALADPAWDHNPDIALGMIAYMGFPLCWPDGTLFGTVCVLDRHERHFTPLQERLLSQCAAIVQDDLRLLISQRDLALEAATRRTNEEKFRKFFQSNPSAIVLSRFVDGMILEANGSYSELTGYALEELVGKTSTQLNLFSQGGRQKIIDMLLKSGSIHDYDLEINTKNGQQVRILLSMERMRIGSIDCILSTMQNITDLRRLQDDLRSMNERFSLAAHAAHIGVWDWDITSDTLIWDDEMYALYAMQRKAPCPSFEDWKIRLHPDDIQKSMDEVHKALSGEQEYNAEFRILLEDGSCRYIKAAADITRDEQGRAIRMIGVNYDVTAQKTLEIQLAESERVYRDLFHENPALRFLVDAETGRIVDANPAAIEFYGYPKEKFIGIHLKELNGLEQDINMESMRLAMSRKRNCLQVRHRLANGELRDMEIYNNPIVINGHNYLSGFLFDVTGRVRAEEQLKQSEERYRSIFHRNFAVKLIVDIDTGLIEEANSTACDFYGYSEEEISTKHLWDLNPATEEFIRGKLEQTYAAGANLVTTKHIRHDGEVRDVEVFSGRLDLDGRRCVYAIVHDVTESMQAKRELQQSETRFSLLVDSAPDAIFLLADGRFSFVNPAGLRLMGARTQEDFLGKTAADFVRRGDADTGEPIAFGSVYGRECTLIRLDGSPVSAEITSQPIDYPGQSGVFVFARDITQRKEMERQQKEMQAQLTQSQKLEAIGMLAGGVAHEINNPLNGILNYAQLIADDAQQAGGSAEYAEEIIRESKRVATIVQNLLRFSRQEKQAHSLAQFKDIVEETLSLIRTVIRHDQITLSVDIPDNLPSLKCRSQQIQQVIMNLLTNARDALNQKYHGYHSDKIIDMTCTQFFFEGRRWLRLIVEDHGTGIPEKIRDKIFNPFFTTKPRDSGTGLGLSISHSIVKDHHGKLYFISEENWYTKAVLELPIDNGWDLESH